MNWRRWVFPVSFVLATIVTIALWETGTYSKWGKTGIIIGVFLGPSFALRAYTMWTNREQLQNIYYMSQNQFSIIKNKQRQKEKEKEKRKKTR